MSEHYIRMYIHEHDLSIPALHPLLLQTLLILELYIYVRICDMRNNLMYII